MKLAPRAARRLRCEHGLARALGGGLLRPNGLHRQYRSCRFDCATPKAAQREVEHDLVVPQPLPALYQTEVAYHAIMSAAHPREPRIFQPTHG